MKTPFRWVNLSLQRTARTWRWLRCLQHGSTLGAMVALYFLGLALAMAHGWVTHPNDAKGLIIAGIAAMLSGGVIIAAGVWSKELPRGWLAQQVERGQPKLLDRVNTLVALERTEARPEATPFYRRIGQQAQALLARQPPSSSISSRRALVHFAVCVALVLATWEVYQRFSPWERLMSAHRARPVASAPAPPEPTLELPPPPDVVKTNQPWVEVRITEPARDLQVTKVDVVPLQIEAAANAPLESVGWINAINGQTQQTHTLPPPADPQHAVYQVPLYLDEFKLSDWDVMTYYAQAATQSSNRYASDIYFLEVRPFREDILKMPGGEDGKAMQCVNALSALIHQQQHVVRQTHQHVQSPPESPKVKEQDRNKLADAETDLKQGTQHLYAKMAADLENQAIGEALDHLARAETTLDQAARALRKEFMRDAQTHERSALANLVAARKAFQKSVSDNPKSFEEQPPVEPPPAAEPPDVLKQIAEFRNEQKAAQAFMDQMVTQQTLLADRVRTNAPETRPRQATEQTRIQQSLQEFQEQHPQAFKAVKPETSAACQSLEQATQSLKDNSANAPTRVQKAADQLRKLADKMQDKSAERQLTGAYQLKQLLDQQIEKFAQCEHPGEGTGPSTAELKQTVAGTRQTLKELKNLATQEPTKGAFGPALGASLSEVNRLKLHWPLSELEQPLPPEARQKAAGQVKDGLTKVSQAFDASLPRALQAPQPADATKPPASHFERGLAQLDSLIHQLEDQRPVSPDEQKKQAMEAGHNLQRARQELDEGDASGNPVLARAETMLTPERDLPKVEVLKQLRNELQALSEELVARRRQKVDQSEITAMDPNRLPPAYRSRIERYFQKLSEP